MFGSYLKPRLTTFSARLKIKIFIKFGRAFLNGFLEHYHLKTVRTVELTHLKPPLDPNNPSLLLGKPMTVLFVSFWFVFFSPTGPLLQVL